MRQIVYIFVFLLTTILYSHTFAKDIAGMPEYVKPPEVQYNNIMNNFKRNAHCKISPTSKVLLAIPQDRDFEKKYVVDDEEILRQQCKKGVMTDIYIQNA